MDIIELGEGDRVVFVHGDIFDAESTWVAQRLLAQFYRVLLVNRRGYGDSPEADGEDFSVDADDVAGVLESGPNSPGWALLSWRRRTAGCCQSPRRRSVLDCL